MKLRHYTIITTLALLAASCAHEESEVAQISDIQLAITAAFATPAADFAAAGVGVGDESAAENSAKSATKATATAFESGDLLGLYAVKSGGELSSQSNLINNHQLKVAESGAIVGDQLPAYYPDKSSSLDLFSYFPYQSGNATADALGVLVGIRTHQTDFSHVQASDLCYGRKLDAAPSAAPHPLQFSHSFAQLRLNFSLYEGCSVISAVKLLSIKDSAKLNLQTGLVTLLTTSVADVEPYVGSLVNSADATNPLQFTAIIPAQSLSGACVEITLTDGTIYYYHAVSPITLKESATNTLNLTLSDKGKLTLASTPAITAWGVEESTSNISESTDNAFTFYWSPAITSFASINKAFVTLTNPATKKSARIEVAAFVRDATSTAANAIFRFAITRTDAASIGYPVTIDKFELFNGGTAVHTLTDYYGRTVTRSGAHTFGTVTSIKLSPDGDWLNAANTAQSRSVTIATTGSTSWVASTSPSGIGLSVSPTSGANSATATISWAAQLTTGDSPLRSGTVTFTTVPDGVSYVVSTSQLMGPYYLAVNPATAWANVANTAQSRSHAIATGNLAGWTATATSAPTAGLTVTASGTSTNGTATPAVATWAAQAVGALARNGSVTITPNPATVGGVATTAPITIATNQAAGPAPTLTLALTDAIDSPIPAGGKAYKATITSNHAWTASALTNVTLDKSKGAAGATAVVVTVPMTNSTSTRTVSAIFTTNPLPSGAVASQTWSGNQIAYPQYITINGLKWATGNLVADGANGAKIGAPIDGGLYFQYGGLIGYKGGENGDGRGMPPSTFSGKFWDGADVFSSNDISVTPTGYSKSTHTYPDFRSVATGGYGYYYYRSFTTIYVDFQSQANGKDISLGIGDACTHYLGSPWRLPNYMELHSITGSVSPVSVVWIKWSEALNGMWVVNGPPANRTPGAWFGPNAKTAPNLSTDLFFLASGFRREPSGYVCLPQVMGYFMSSSNLSGEANIFMDIHGSERLGINASDYKENAMPVRCVKN